MVFTDPPYGMKKESDGVANDNLNFDELLEFNKKWIPISFEFLSEVGSWYCWGIDEPLMDIYSSILKPMKKANKITIRNYITWAKHMAQGINSKEFRCFPVETEKCWFVMKGVQGFNTNSDNYFDKWDAVRVYLEGEAAKVGLTPKKLKEICGVQMYSHWFTKSQWMFITEEHYKELQEHYREYGAFKREYDELKREYYNTRAYFDNVGTDSFGDIGLTDVWRIPTTSGEEKESAGGHATPKPLALCRRAIKASSRENEKVLDLFGGSGSTLIACEQLGRSCMMMEYEPKWVEVIIRRWENLSGKKAVKL